MGNANISDAEVLKHLQAGKKPYWLKANLGVSPERSKSIASKNGIDLQARSPSVGRTDPTDGPTDGPTDAGAKASPEPEVAPVSASTRSVGPTDGPTDLPTGLPTHLTRCSGCGVVHHREELATDGLCETCRTGASGNSEALSPSFIKIDQPSFCGTAPPSFPNSSTRPNPKLAAITAIALGLGELKSFIDYLDHYQLFDRKQYKLIKDRVRAAARTVDKAIDEVRNL